MNLARTPLLALLMLAPLACSSTSAQAPSETDGGVDAEAPPPPITQDASAPDSARPDVTPASRLAVACAQDPCYVAVSSNGGEHVCGLLKDGSVRCWGRDSRFRPETPDQADGALGRGRVVTAIEGATPAPVVGLSAVTQISVGPNLGTCARTSDGAVYCWGRNEFGQLGRAPAEPRLSSPTRVAGLPPVSSVALGAKTGCAIATADGVLHCWGATDTHVGAAAASDSSDWFAPQPMTGFRAPVRELTIGTSPGKYGAVLQDTIVAVVEGDVLVSLGELPAGESAFLERPRSPLPYQTSRVVRGGAFGYLSKDGLLSRWLPETRHLYVPQAASVVDIAIVAGRDPDAVAGGPYVEQAGVLLANGRLFRWGRNTAGALGVSPEELDVAEEPLEMTHVVGDRVVSFATTLASTCVSLADGTVKCWGTNQRGELGRGTVDVERHPEAEQIR